MKKNVLIKFDSTKSIANQFKYLHDRWGFSYDDIADIINTYQKHKTINKYSPEHYCLLFELSQRHISKLSDQNMIQGFITCKKAYFLKFHSHKDIEQLLPFASSIISILVTILVSGYYFPPEAFIFCLAFWGFCTCFSIKAKSSLAKQFYLDFFSNLEKEYSSSEST